MRKKEDAKGKDAIKKRRYKGHPPFASASLHKIVRHTNCVTLEYQASLEKYQQPGRK